MKQTSVCEVQIYRYIFYKDVYRNIFSDCNFIFTTFEGDGGVWLHCCSHITWQCTVIENIKWVISPKRNLQMCPSLPFFLARHIPRWVAWDDQLWKILRSCLCYMFLYWDPAIHQHPEGRSSLGRPAERRFFCKVDCFKWMTCRRLTVLQGRV